MAQNQEKKERVDTMEAQKSTNVVLSFQVNTALWNKNNAKAFSPHILY